MIKESVKKLNPYKANQVDCLIKLDANEGVNYLFDGPLDFSDEPFNLYPDSDSTRLRKEITKYLDVELDQVMMGSGSSEMIELIIKTYLEPGEIVLGFEPSFTMFQVYTIMHGGDYQTIPAEDDFSFSIDRLIAKMNAVKPKLVILCSPNNPTGYEFPQKDLIRVLESTEALVLIDEAYSEFSDQVSMAKSVDTYRNLFVTRTFSKAFGLAGARLGYLMAYKDRIEELNRVKTPYNVNRLSQSLGERALERIEDVKQYVQNVAKRREDLALALNSFGFIVYPSKGNFLWVKPPFDNLYQRLLSEGILIRKFSGKYSDYYRITVGLESENQALITALKGMVK